MIDTFLGTLDSRERGYEEGELVLYKAKILEQVTTRCLNSHDMTLN